MTGDAARWNRRGFTLIELLVVVVLLGILAVVMVFRSNEVKRQANLAVLKSDMRSLTVLQEIHFQTEMAYAPLDELSDFDPDPGSDIGLTWIATDGYAATGTHAGAPDITCGVFRGDAEEGVAGPAEVEGALICE